jgi:hypothetical protein
LNSGSAGQDSTAEPFQVLPSAHLIAHFVQQRSGMKLNHPEVCRKIERSTADIRDLKSL